MSVNWSGLYWWSEPVPAAEEVIPRRLRDAVTGLGYSLYDPFDVVPGKAYIHTIKLFVAPPRSGWTRILGQWTPEQVPALVREGLCLVVSLEGAQEDIRVLLDGAEVEAHTALLPHLRPGQTADDLAHALYANTADAKTINTLPETEIPLDMLPEDLQKMANDLNPGQFRRMFKKMMGRFDRQLTSDSGAARELLTETTPQWDSAGGRRIRSVIACLTIPETWREPDFITLRDAYQLQRRREHRPQAHLYPGDAEALAAVPNALQYTPVYGGKND